MSYMKIQKKKIEHSTLSKYITMYIEKNIYLGNFIFENFPNNHSVNIAYIRI